MTFRCRRLIKAWSSIISHCTATFEESFHIEMKNVLLKFLVQQDMLSTCAQSEHTFTCSAEQQRNNLQPNAEAAMVNDEITTPCLCLPDKFELPRFSHGISIRV